MIVTHLVIDISKKTLAAYANEELLGQFPVTVGKSDTPTPQGQWRVAKKVFSPGGSYGSRLLVLNVPSRTCGIHGTDEPNSVGTAASGG